MNPYGIEGALKNTEGKRALGRRVLLGLAVLALSAGSISVSDLKPQKLKIAFIGDSIAALLANGLRNHSFW